MSDNIPYPQSTVWFVKAIGPNGKEGSAVAVRLRKDSLQGSERTYLLTCAHVIRREGVQQIHSAARTISFAFGQQELDTTSQKERRSHPWG